jgi:hypothetical protein
MMSAAMAAGDVPCDQTTRASRPDTPKVYVEWSTS